MILAASFPAACVVPIVQPTGTPELSLKGFPPGTEAAEAISADGLTLRGVFLPAGPGAPVVLHLLPSEASATTGLLGIAGWKQTLEVLRLQGYSSLALDYRGVGASDGDPDPTALPEDGASMWDEAVRRAGGESGKVVLRAASLGTIPAAALLEAGRQPRCVVLYAPIRSETIAVHAPRARRGPFLGTIVSWFLKRPTEVDLVEALRETEVHVLVVASREDRYLPEGERELLFAAAEAGGNPVVLFEGDHLQLVSRAYGFEWGEFAGRVIEELLEAERLFLAAQDPR